MITRQLRLVLTAVSLATLLLAGCAETSRNMEQVDGFYAQARAEYGSSIYLRHPETGKIAECSPSGVAFPDPFGIAARAVIGDCVKRWQGRGYSIGLHDELKTAVKRDRSLQADR
jgi:hypothetical protein